MSTLFRHSLRLSITRATAYRPTALTASSPILPRRRAYAAKRARSKHGGGAESPHGSKRAPIATESLTPGSQQALADPAARDGFARTDAKMAACVERLRRELLAPVRVSVAPSSSSSSASAAGKGASVSTKVRLEEVATVGVRDGSTLIVTVFEPQNLKHIQDALYEAKIQGVIPQPVDERTLRIPIPKPTVEARLAAYSTASNQAEDVRVQIRRHHQASVKKGKYSRHSIEHEEFQKLQDRHIAEVDAVLAQVKKSTGAR
ncbi:ribosome recycling factor-domain-containing protein [Russula brevipes]|nr:ribosome recycling factor-domain-containing protein [Russula brevipes]